MVKWITRLAITSPSVLDMGSNVHRDAGYASDILSDDASDNAADDAGGNAADI